MKKEIAEDKMPKILYVLGNVDYFKHTALFFSHQKMSRSVINSQFFKKNNNKRYSHQNICVLYVFTVCENDVNF